MEGNEAWAVVRRMFILVAIVLFILTPFVRFLYMERGFEDSIDFLAERIIGVMFAGLLVGAFVLFDKLSNKMFNKQE